MTASMGGAGLLATGAQAAGRAPSRAQVVSTTARAATATSSTSGLVRAGTVGRSTRPHDFGPTCTFNGSPGPVISVAPGSSVAISCTGWLPSDDVTVFEI
ncbi:MAG TPA: hypothetical protein VF320_12685, partial [Acidimicrobiales bacterium]